MAVDIKERASLPEQMRIMAKYYPCPVLKQGAARIEELETQLAAMREALRSVVTQCGNVIYNCEQMPAGNTRHLNSWREVQKYAQSAALRGSVQHHSDCALHNAPAYDPGPCDCGTVKD